MNISKQSLGKESGDMATYCEPIFELPVKLHIKLSSTKTSNEEEIKLILNCEVSSLVGWLLCRVRSPDRSCLAPDSAELAMALHLHLLSTPELGTILLR
jgi:hypothetical protein